MSFTHFCVGIVVTALTALFSLLVGQVCNVMHDPDDFGFGPWLISTMALGCMITMKLIEEGLI